MVDKRIFPTKRPACEHKDVKGQVGIRNSEKAELEYRGWGGGGNGQK